MSFLFSIIPLAHIVPSPTNSPKRMNPVTLKELSEDIGRRGVDTPITVRPLPGNRVQDTDRNVQFEIVCGHRRFKASEMANLKTIPAMVRTLNNIQSLEVQLIENLGRQDLSPIEEAEGYEMLMKEASLNVDQIAEKVGKSRSYIYGRLKLLDLCEEARDVLHNGKIDASCALLVARIPNNKLQVKAINEILEGASYPWEPMTHRQAFSHIQQNYMLNLKDARFEITSENLIDGTGSCKNCEKRTGHNPELFTDIKGADICTDPTCFHEKEQAHAANLIKAAKDRGQTVIFGKEAQELQVQNSYGGKLIGYSRLDSAEDSPTEKPLRKIIGNFMQSEGINAVLIESKTGEFVECVSNEVKLKLLKLAQQQATDSGNQASHESFDESPKSPKISKEIEELLEQKKLKAEAKAKASFEEGWREKLMHHTWQVINQAPAGAFFNVEVHRFVALKSARSLTQEVTQKIGKFLGLEKIGTNDALLDYIKNCENPSGLHLMILMANDSNPNDFAYPGHPANEAMHFVSEIVLGDLIKEKLKTIKKEALVKFFPKIREEKVPPPLAPAAQAYISGGEVNKKTEKPKKTTPARAAKMSEADAKSGIADALQGMDRAASEPSGSVALPENAPVEAAEMVGQGSKSGIADALQGNDRAVSEPSGSVAPPEAAAGVEGDALFAQAVAVVVRERIANVRLLKTELKIGSERAMKLMRLLKQSGTVRALDSDGMRTVLVASEN